MIYDSEMTHDVTQEDTRAWRLSAGSRVTVVFLLLSVPWILLGDYLVGTISTGDEGQLFQTLKGLFFVVVCSAVLKWMVDRHEARMTGVLSRERALRLQLERAERVGEFGSWQRDLDTGEGSTSSEIREILGCDGGALEDYAAALRDRLHPEDRDRVEAARATLLAERAIDLEYRIVRPDGDEIWLRERAEVVRDEAGRDRFAVGTVRDITRLMQAEEKKREAQEIAEQRGALARMAAEKAHFGGWRYDVATGLETWTEGTARIRGLEEVDTITPEAAMAPYVERDREKIARLFRACVTEGVPFDDTFRMIREDGDAVTVRTIGEPEYDADGRITAVQGAVQDVTDLVEAREEADRRNAELESVLSAIGDGFVTVDRNWCFTFVNRRAARLTGHEPEELMGHDLWEAFPEARGSVFERKCHAAMQSGKSQVAVEYEPSEGTFLEANIHPLPEGVAIYVTDVSAQHRTRRWLELLEAAVDSTDDIVAIVETGPDGGPQDARTIYVNPAFAWQLGIPKDDVIGQLPWFLNKDTVNAPGIENIERAFAHGVPGRAELFTRTRDRAGRWFELRTTPIRDAQGKVRHWVAIHRDITERKGYEERILQSEERFRLISRASSDVIWDWDIETGSFWLSDNYEDVFGIDISDEPSTFEASMARIHPDDQARIRESLEETIQSDRVTWSGEYRVRNADGGYSIIEDRAFVIRDGTGKAVRMVAGMTDVTRIRALDQRLIEAEKLEAIGHLTGGIAHDFNNLLTIILGTTDLLLEDLEDARQQKMARVTIQAAEQGAQLVDALLAYSRRQPLTPEPVDVNTLISQSLPLFRKGIDAGIEIHHHLDAPQADVLADPGRLQSALLNLVLNSRDAMGERGTITIRTEMIDHDGTPGADGDDRPAGRYVAIHVIDDGAGMGAETREQAFKPFYTTKQPGKGTGLGLSSIYGFVKQSGGHARICSEPGRGTTVSILLPLSEAPAARGKEAAYAGASPVAHILIVEDDAALRAHAVELVESLGHEVSVAEDADAALEYLEHQPDVTLMFTDVVMSGSMNGDELARIARARHPGLKVLFTSGYTQDAFMSDGRLEPGIDLLVKPYRREALQQKLNEILAG
jgi:PAS domain S-box-containing protein